MDDDQKAKPAPSASADTATYLASAHAPGAESDLSGAKLGSCVLTRLIATGGMGQVYEAQQTKLSRKVAVKVVMPSLAARPEFLQRFEREAKLAAALNHPNVVQVFDFGEASGRHYLVMEYIEGENLSEYVERKGKLPVAEALAMIEQAVLALRTACAKSIIHRDIKPSNLMLTREGVLKVSDLGLAKLVSEASDVTQTGAGIGSPHFLAPEQADDARVVDHRADMYALGITLLYLLTGKRPFDGGTPYAVVLAHVNKPLPKGAALGTALPGPVEAFIGRLAAKRPEDRYANYDDLLADLEKVKAGQGLGRNAGSKRSPTGQLALVAAAVIVVSLVAGKLMSGSMMAKKPEASPSAANNAPPPERGQPGDDPGPDNFRKKGPNTKGGPRFGGAGGRFPLLQPQEPEWNAIAEGPVDKMLAEADAYAKANPTKYRGIIDRYHQVAEKANGTPLGPQVGQRLDDAVDNHRRAVEKALADFEKRTQAMVDAKSPQEAFQTWLNFPVELRTAEVDEELVQRIRAMMPPNFQPVLPNGPGRKAKGN